MNSVSNAEKLEQAELRCSEFIDGCHKMDITYSDILRILLEASIKLQMQAMAESKLRQ